MNLADYSPEAFVEDVEMLLQAMAYDVRLQRVRTLAANMVRDARRSSHGREA